MSQMNGETSVAHASSPFSLFVRFVFGTILASLREPQLVGRWWASRVTGLKCRTSLTSTNYLEQGMYQAKDWDATYNRFCRKPLIKTVQSMGFQYCWPKKLTQENKCLFVPTIAAKAERRRTPSAVRLITLLSSILLPFSFRSLTPEGGGCRHLHSVLQKLSPRQFSAMRCAVTKTDTGIFLLSIHIAYDTATLSACVHPHPDIENADSSVGLGRWVDSPTAQQATFHVILQQDIADCLHNLVNLFFMTDKVASLGKSHAWLRNAFSTRTHRFSQEYFDHVQEMAECTFRHFLHLKRCHQKALGSMQQSSFFSV